MTVAQPRSLSNLIDHVNTLPSKTLNLDSIQSEIFQLVINNEPALLKQIKTINGTIQGYIFGLFDGNKEALVKELLTCDNSIIKEYIKENSEPLLEFYFSRSRMIKTLDICKLFVANGLDLSFNTYFPFRMAASYGTVELVQFLLDNSAREHIDDHDEKPCRHSALHYAYIYDRYEIVELLLKEGANPNTIKKEMNKTMLDLIAKYAKPSSVPEAVASDTVAPIEIDPYGFSQITELPVSPKRDDFSGPNGQKDKCMFFSAICAEIQETVMVQSQSYTRMFADIDRIIMLDFANKLAEAKKTLTVVFDDETDILRVSK